MRYLEAIRKSPKKTATRTVTDRCDKITYVIYRDGSGVKMRSRNGNIISVIEAKMNELAGYTDWEPSKDKS